MAEQLSINNLLSTPRPSHKLNHDKSFFSSARHPFTPRPCFGATSDAYPSVLHAPAVFPPSPPQTNTIPALRSIRHSTILRRRSLPREYTNPCGPGLTVADGTSTPPLRASALCSPTPSPTPSPSSMRSIIAQICLPQIDVGKLNTRVDGPGLPAITLSPQAHALVNTTNRLRELVSPADVGDISYIVYGAEITATKSFDQQTFYTDMDSLCSKSRYFAQFGLQDGTFRHKLHNVDPKVFRAVLDWIEKGTLNNLPEGVDPALQFLESMDILALKLKMDGLRSDIQPVMECLRYESLKDHFFKHGFPKVQGPHGRKVEDVRKAATRQKITLTEIADEGISME